jgi:uracil-DNA glycosylase
LKPQLLIPVGKLAIAQLIELAPLTEIIGKKFTVSRDGIEFDVIPLPHPSGASPWHRMEPGKTLLKKGLALISKHPAWKTLVGRDVSPKRPL